MAKAKASEQQALIENESTSLATATHSGLSLVEVDDDFGEDGLSEIDPSDIKIALYVWNMQGIDPETRRQIPSDVFYNTVTESTVPALEVVLLDLHKTFEWREYSEAEKKSTVYCRSSDRVTGTMEDGTQRSCQLRPDGRRDCPDAQWVTGEDGTRSQRCADVATVAAIELENEQLVVLRFKKSSMPAWKQHLNRHHLGRAKDKTGKVKNVPLRMFSVKLVLKLAPTGKYATPLFEKIGTCDPKLLASASAAFAFYKNVGRAAIEKQLEKVADAEDGGRGGDTSFNTSEYVDAPSEDVPSGGKPSFPHE